MEISIVIPVYNKAEYLEKCFKSIFSQTFDSFEVIAVNDGSSDSSGEICNQWAEKELRLRVVHTENGGVTAARRKGVETAKGRYIVFADADDEILPGGLQTLYNTIEQTGADEVIARFQSQDKVMSPVVFNGFAETTLPIWYIITGKNRFPVLWACIFRRELLDNVLDTPRTIIEGEDKLMQVKILMKQPKVYFSDACVYEYSVGLPNTRRRTLEREQLYDDILRQVLAPRWNELSSGFILHQLKEYEKFVHEGQFDVRQQYYSKAIGKLPADIPLYDSIVWHLPPCISQYLIRFYKKIIKIKQRGL